MILVVPPLVAVAVVDQDVVAKVQGHRSLQAGQSSDIHDNRFTRSRRINLADLVECRESWLRRQPKKKILKITSTLRIIVKSMTFYILLQQPFHRSSSLHLQCTHRIKYN